MLNYERNGHADAGHFFYGNGITHIPKQYYQPLFRDDVYKRLKKLIYNKFQYVNFILTTSFYTPFYSDHSVIPTSRI
ncbi:MAG: hypothetical protein CMN45_09085 [SAR116 cluster bacterium]|nr:hypothetical protein [SAR116 cluster bacterium]